MFHRVKPEAQDQQQTEQDSANQTENTQAQDVQPAKMPQEQTPQQQSSPAPAANQFQNQNSNQEKDQDTMTEDQNTDASENTEAKEEDRSLDIPESAYQRSGTAPARAMGSPYPAAGNFAGGYNAGSAAVSSSEGNDRKLTIGRGITMSGEIESCDHLMVEGTVEAALKGASLLEIAESGVFYGTVEIDEATVAGRFEGDITVNGRLTIRSSGTITGSIAYKELEVESGAVIDGKLTPVAKAGEAKKPAPKKEAQPAPKAKDKAKETQEPANTDGELFSGKAAAAE